MGQHYFNLVLSQATLYVYYYELRVHQMAMTPTDLIRKGRSLKGTYSKNPSAVKHWICEVERTYSFSLSWNTDLGIYVSQLKNNPDNSVKFDKVIEELENAEFYYTLSS